MKPLLRRLASLNITLACLIFLMLLVFFGTLDQVHLGIFAAQKKYFLSLFVMAEIAGYKVPVLPGGVLVAAVLTVNLLSALYTRFAFTWRYAGLVCTHIGVVMLIVGGGITSFLAAESQMAIEEGQTRAYSEDDMHVELAVIRTSGPNYDEVVSIPYSLLRTGRRISHALLPFDVVIRKFLPNAELAMQDPSTGAPGLPDVTRGIGMQIAVQPRPPVHADDKVNNETAYVELMDGDRSLGTWLLARFLGAPQGASVKGEDYELSIRPTRHYNDYTITLKDFTHDVYPGTQIPKNFSSLIHLNDPTNGQSRDVLIYMNNPLRYKGKTYYQASFGKNDTLSVLQVVENPGWLFPYLSCLMISLGLLAHFMQHLADFAKRRGAA